MYSSVLSELDFQPQLWLTENTSGALVNRVRLAPVALAHAIAKYADTDARWSRYGCCGETAGAVAGSVLPAPSVVLLLLLLLPLDVDASPLGSDDASAGELGVDMGVVLRESGSIGRPENE